MTSAVDAIARGTRFLLAARGSDGLWRDFRTPAGEASLWPSGFIGTALLATDVDRSAELWQLGNALLARQNPDGGWGYNEDVPTDADSTAWVLMLLAGLGRVPDCRRAVSCLLRHQCDNGGFPTYRDAAPIRRFTGLGRWVPFGGWCSPHIDVSAAAACALAAAAGERCAQNIGAAWDFVRSRQRPDGSWSSYWWCSAHYATLQAARVAVLAGDRDVAVRAARWAARDGAASPFTTALMLSILLAANVSGDPIQRAVRRLITMQRSDGGWPSQPMLRIPPPGERDPNREHWRPVRFAGGVVVDDQHRSFTTATCVAALSQACGGG